jgi:hypothetical protein
MGTHSRLLARALNVDLLVLDDFGLQPLTAQGVQDLYEIICERYERGSIIVTSNRSFDEWPEMFGNDLLASAGLDRLTHHAHTMIIRGQSYRQRSRRKENDSALSETPSQPRPSPNPNKPPQSPCGLHHRSDGWYTSPDYRWYTSPDHGWYTSGGD